jgi:hypothetical protein
METRFAGLLLAVQVLEDQENQLLLQRKLQLDTVVKKRKLLA